MRQDFLDFFDAEYALVVRFMMRMGADLADAEDAMQHVAEQGWRMVVSGRWDQIAHPRAWARRVARNHHLAQCRKRDGTGLRPDVDTPEPGPGHAELIGQARDLVALLQRLNVDCRAVIAFTLDAIPDHDIAAALETTPQQVRDLRKKARRQLARHLATATHSEGGNRQ
ncbi:RNA polymerase sigma factor [Thermomonospora umbrina]|uniref:RNA polymerase sigma factor (Sigma-70 family) n=1 Tax=Thermomonospora umbrina TaxID=111806 RepID=A0A3D9SX87_9ACTN|nr:sigma-70 family RNA polymerase sigma factor [Thermomonospora umbrina]REF00459.1 RNA polymerase sigma factor (sigma-70 family) [Thermomonospora umbrina]